MLSLGSGRQLDAGNFNHGGPTSSTLSPLAPPFTVDRSLQKPKDNPIHAVDPCFNAAYDYTSNFSTKNWLHLHPPTTVSDGYSHQNSEFDPSFGANSCYGGASSIRNTGSPLSPTRRFPYSQNSETGPNVRIEPDIYYGQYPSGIIDNNASVIDLLAPLEESPQPEFFPNRSGFGISTSVTIPSEASSQADLSQNLSDFGYGTKWTGLWHGQFDGEQDQMEDIASVDGEFSWKGNESLSSNYRCLLQQGNQPQQHQSGSDECSSIWHEKYNESLARQACVGRKGHDLKNSHVKSFSVEKGNPSFSISRISALPPQLHDLASMQAWNPLDLTSVSVDRSFTQLGSSTTNPTVHPSVANFPATQVYEPLASIISTCRGSDGKDGYALTSRSCDDGNMDNRMFVSSPTKEALPSTNVLFVGHSLSHLSKGKNESSTSCTTLLNSERPGDSVKSSESFDPFIPAVDSPCWKGAPASQYFPFGISKIGVPLTAVDQFEGCNGINDHAAVISSPQLSGSWICPESFPRLEPKSAASDKTCSKFSKDEVGNCFSVDFSKSWSEVKASNTVSNVCEDKITSDGLYFKGTKQDGPSDFVSQTREPVSNLTSKSLNASRIDSRMLVKTMHNLSEVLLSCCHSYANALEDGDFELLKLVMDNLGKCILKVRVAKPTPGSFSQLGTSLHNQEWTDSRKVTAIGKSGVTGSEIGYPINIEGTMLSNWSPTKMDTFHDSTSIIEDMDFDENNGMTQEMGKFLNGNFCELEDKHPRTVLYRDLWIKAEASLCSMKYQLRLAQLKIEMEKHKQQVVKGNLGSVAMDSLNSPTKPAQKPVNVKEVKSSNVQGIGNQGEEYIESSVMARFRVLQHRIDNLNSTNEEVQQLSPDLEVQERTPNQFCSGRKSKAWTGQPMRIVNVGFTDKRPWPFVSDRQCGDGFGIGSEDLEEQEKTRELGICIDSPLIPSKIRCHVASPVPPLGLESPDSESGYGWEHVPRDGLAW